MISYNQLYIYIWRHQSLFIVLDTAAAKAAAAATKQHQKHEQQEKQHKEAGSSHFLLLVRSVPALVVFVVQEQEVGVGRQFVNRPCGGQSSEGPVHLGRSRVPLGANLAALPDERAAEARARVERLEAWRGQNRRPTAQGNVEEGSRPVSRVACLREIGFNIEVHPEISDEDREDGSRVGREKTSLQQALVSLERLRDEAANSVSEPPHNSRPPQAQMDVEDPEEEIQRLRAQVGELQQERVAGHKTEESLAQKARILSTPALDLAPLHSGAAGSRSASDLMQNLMNAADSTLEEVLISRRCRSRNGLRVFESRTY